jgi:hypothetical protein
MHRFWVIIGSVFALAVVFGSSFGDRADARVIRDIESCVRNCIFEDGNIYSLMECIGLCSRYPRAHPLMQYRSRGGLSTRSDCREAARAMFPQESRYRRLVRHICKSHLH